MGGCSSTPIGRRGRGHAAAEEEEEEEQRLPGRVVVSRHQLASSAAASFSLFSQQGCKGINQDAMIIWEDFGGSGGVLCGVFDGHGPQGHLVSRKVRDALPLKLLSSLPLPAIAAADADVRRPSCFRCLRASRRPEEPSLSAWKHAFARSFKAMDRTLSSHRSLNCFCSGTTAVTLLRLGMNLYIGNIGDSRAVLGSVDENGSSMAAVQLTVDLKPDLPKEAERIKRLKGRVFALQGEPEVMRVWLPFEDAPGLAMARAFGDFCVKDYGVISVPEFSHWKLTERDRFVVLASDGVWDVFSNQEVVDIVASSPSRMSAAKFLVEAAAREWLVKYPTSRIDDCTAVCLYLDGKTGSEFDSKDNSTVSTTICSPHPIISKVHKLENREPSLNRNLTLRSKENRNCETGEYHLTEDGNWSGLEGVTRVNSLVQLPRFSDKKND